MELDDRILAVPVGSHSDELRGVIKLNETAALIFNLLKEETTEENIVDELKEVYDVPLEVLKTDVHSYIEGFQKEGLLA